MASEAKAVMAVMMEKMIDLCHRAEDLRRDTAIIYKEMEKLANDIQDITPVSWLSPEAVAEHFAISRQTVDRRLVEMEKLGSRYAGCIVREPKCVRVQLGAFMDYERFRDLLTNEKTRKCVPAYLKTV